MQVQQLLVDQMMINWIPIVVQNTQVESVEDDRCALVDWNLIVECFYSQVESVEDDQSALIEAIVEDFYTQVDFVHHD